MWFIDGVKDLMLANDVEIVLNDGISLTEETANKDNIGIKLSKDLPVYTKNNEIITKVKIDIVSKKYLGIFTKK